MNPIIHLACTLITVVTYFQIPLVASNQIPERFIEKFSLPPDDLTQVEFENYLKSINNLNKEINDEINKLLAVQKIEISNYKSNPPADLSYQKLNEVIELNALQKDKELIKADDEFSQGIIQLFKKYQIEAREQHSNNYAVASRAAASFASQGMEDSPGARIVTVAVPQSGVIIVHKFNKDLSPTFHKYMIVYNKHIFKLRTFEQASKNLTSSSGVLILTRAVEIQDLQRFQTLINGISNAYYKILHS
jgi:hypothetical protein